MKTAILFLSLAVAGLPLATSNVSAQGYDPRIDAARLAPPDASRDYQGDRGERDRNYDRRDDRGAGELDQLNREVRDLRLEIGNSRSERIRERFHRLKEAAASLNYQARRGTMRGSEVRRRVEDIRAGLQRLRQEIRARRSGMLGSRFDVG